MQKKWGKMAQNSNKNLKMTLYLMIYVKLVENLVSYSEEHTEYDNIIYILDWDLKKLIDASRPWKILSRKDNVYKPKIIEELFETWKFEDDQPDEYLDKFSPALLEDIIELSRELEKYGIIKPRINEFPRYTLEYNCDILNMLEEYYGESNLEIIQEFIDLGKEDLDLIRSFYKEITNEKKLKLLQSSYTLTPIERIINFLPPWCKDYIKIFGLDINSRAGEDYYIPEYCNKKVLGDPGKKIELKKEMVDEIYEEFKIGSVLRGSEIRTRFREIYRKYGLNPKATLVDFMEYFVIRKAKSEYEWYYRIIRRKKDEVLENITRLERQKEP